MESGTKKVKPRSFARRWKLMRAVQMGRNPQRSSKFRAFARRWKYRLKGLPVPDLAAAQPMRLSSILPYEDFIEYKGCHYVLLSDGSLGIAWSLPLVGHEVLTPAQVGYAMQAFARVLESNANDKATFQLIWDSSPSARFQAPPYAAAPTTYAQRIMAERIETIRKLAFEPTRRLRCMRRQLWLTLRWQRPGRLGLDDKSRGVFLGGSATADLEREAEKLADELREIHETTTLIEEGLQSNGFLAFERCDPEAFLELVRSGHHSIAAREKGWGAYTPGEPLSQQTALEFVTAAPSALQLGDTDSDTIQVLSWAQKPTIAFEGMMSFLLQLREPVRVVLNVRPCKSLSDLDNKALMLRFALDALGKRQMQEITAAQERLAHNEQAYYVSLHLLVRNAKCTLSELRMRNVGQMVANRLMTLVKIKFHVETHAAPLVYRQCVPLGYSPASNIYSRRDRRVLSSELSKYLPMFSGFSGTYTKSQLMLSRAGEPIYLSSKDCQTSPHIAVLASTGGGKSFWLANYLCGDRALDPSSLDFIIDNKTSYEVLARLFGEEAGFTFSRPPETFPNMFLGALDEDRLQIMVRILRTAISLASPSERLTAEHTIILANALRKTFEANYLDAGTAYRDGELVHQKAKHVLVPKLSDVVDKFNEVCLELNIQGEVGAHLRNKLTPYFGSGPYAALFDADCVAEAEPPTPAVTLIDLNGVVSDPILGTLTAQICISDVLRQIKKPENRHRRGRLVFEELGTLGSRSEELVEFAREAWKTLRKLKYTCIGLTNEVDDYRFKDACQTVWSLSPTKVILPMLPDDLAKTKVEAKGVPRLIGSDMAVALLGTLEKVDGVFSEGFWIGDRAGTFTYAPTGHDYWLAASKREEVSTVKRLAEAIGGEHAMWRAVTWLARNAPNGLRTEANEVREITDEELEKAAEEARCEREPAIEEEEAA